MSYRAFKRLLGETSLERKCRFLFGAGILLLITGSFWLYAYLTENLAYEETKRNCRLLVEEIRNKRHKDARIAALEAKLGPKESQPLQPDIPGQYQFHWLHENDPNLEPYDRDVLKDLARTEEPKDEASRLKPGEKLLYYYGAVRAKESCLACHQKLTQAKLQKNDLLGTVRIRMSTEAIVDAVHVNRAVLMATALGTALCHCQAGQAPQGSFRRHLRRRAQRPQRDPDRRRVRGPQPRLQPHASQPRQHAGPVPQSERRPRSQGGRAGPGQHGPL